MTGEISIQSDLDKAGKYTALLPQIEALLDDSGKNANLGNLMAALKFALNFWWVGIYEVRQNQLVLDVFQGPVACTTIQKGKGVCGISWEKEEIIIVEDVNQFPGHIACSSASRSEIVIPGRNKAGDVAFILDVDSTELAAFDETDSKYLQSVVSVIERFY